MSMSVVVNTSFWKILILLKIHIVINFVSKVFKNTPYWYKISDKNQNNTTNFKKCETN